MPTTVCVSLKSLTRLRIERHRYHEPDYILLLLIRWTQNSMSRWSPKTKKWMHWQHSRICWGKWSIWGIILYCKSLFVRYASSVSPADCFNGIYTCIKKNSEIVWYSTSYVTIKAAWSWWKTITLGRNMVVPINILKKKSVIIIYRRVLYNTIFHR